MKKLTIAAALMVLVCSLQAQFTYSTNADGTLSLTGYTGSGGAVTIPGVVDGRTVTIIAEAAFEYNHDITAVSIPDSVTDIQGYAFYDCTNLASVPLPAHLNSIGDSAFLYCLSVTNLALPDGLTYIADQSLRDCIALTNISIPGTVTYLGIQALTGNSKLLAINVDPLNPVYSSLDGVLFDKARTMLIQYPGGRV